jgi:dihydropteroate synthase
MGILNVTPDSFSDGGRTYLVDDAVNAARRLESEGADMLDLGGESSRPGAEPVSLDEELRRVVPAVERLAEAVRAPISVDTCKAEVARRALAAGASIVNDITALADPDLACVVAEAEAGAVLMHMRGTPRTMQNDPRYDDVVEEVYAFLARRVEAAEAAGIARERIAVDPGIGFGKTYDHNRLLLRHLARFANIGCVVLVGLSRKGFLKAITGRPVDERVTASVVGALAAIEAGAGVVRVHDVAATADALRVWRALRGPEETR